MPLENPAPRFQVSKLDAARRQLRVAISLWFQDGDEVAVHTLACAAHQIIHDINSKIGGSELLFDSPNFKDEFRKELVCLLKKDSNFFKHADTDPEGVTDFAPQLTELFIMFALVGLENLGLKKTPSETVFEHWFLLCHPQYLSEKGRAQRQELEKSGALRVVKDSSPRRFYLEYMQASHSLQHVAGA